jgi:CHRD domain
MKPAYRSTLALFGSVMTFAAVTPAVADDDNDTKFRTRLSGYNEVHFVVGTADHTTTVPAIRGAISTKATGRFKAEIDEKTQTIDYELSYQDLQGTVTQAHIHFGQQHSVGGIVVWLCQTTGTPAPAAVSAVTPVCPAAGTVTGTIAAAQVLAQAAQGFPAGNFDALVSAIRAGATYANVHSSVYGPGEIRGQLSRGNNHRH